jgi:hypothetical protein
MPPRIGARPDGQTEFAGFETRLKVSVQVTKRAGWKRKLHNSTFTRSKRYLGHSLELQERPRDARHNIPRE